MNSAFLPEGFEFWSLDVNGGDEWKVEDLSGDQRKEFPNDQVKKYFLLVRSKVGGSWGGGNPKSLLPGISPALRGQS